MRKSLVFAAVLAVGIRGLAVAAEETASDAAPAILGTRSYWRCHVTLQPPLIGTATDARPAFAVMKEATGKKKKKSRLKPLPPDQPATPFPQADWMQPAFDDSGWWRDPGPFFGGSGKLRSLTHHPHASRYGADQSTALALLCVRGKFKVTDPGQVKRLTLACEFRGGMRVYLNGSEVTRRYLAKGEIGFETLAEDYPVEVSTLVTLKKQKNKGDSPLEKRVRQLEPLEIPVTLLRKGTNVLAIEIHRCATHPDLWDAWDKSGCRVTTPSIVWGTVGLLSVRLSADGSGIVPNAARPQGVQVWNANTARSVGVTDYGDPNESLRPVRIVGARNGTFSGQVVVGSNAAIGGLKAELGPFVSKSGGNGSALPVGTLYYSQLGQVEAYAKSTLPVRGGSPRFEILNETAPAEIPVRQVTAAYRVKRDVGAVQPVWIMVRVPAGAASGEYEAKLTIHPAGVDPVVVPVRLTVCPFRLPDTKDYVTWADFIQSPESLSLAYKVPLWSDAHFRLIGKSFRLLAGVGNKTLYIPLLCRTSVGNTESMVRWITKGDGTYEHDFEPMEKYLDLALECGLAPKVVCLQIWDYHIGHATDVRLGHLGASKGEVGSRAVPVSLLDTATGNVEEMFGPAYADAEAEAFWAPVARGIMERLKARGLGDAAMVGICGDSVPGMEVVKLWEKLLPEAPWVVHAHGWSKGNAGGLNDRQRVGYVAFVVGSWAPDPGIRRDYGWQSEDRVTYFPRLTFGLPLTFHRTYFELNMQSGRRGMGRLAADFFTKAVSARSTRGIAGRYRESSWGNLNLRKAWLAGGTEGTLSTTLMENAREGIQECEARIFIEQALLSKELRAKLPAGLAERCRKLLDRRTRHIAWAIEFSNVWGARHSFLHATGGVLGGHWYTGGSRLADDAERLFTAAGEVAAALETP